MADFVLAAQIFGIFLSARALVKRFCSVAVDQQRAARKQK
jgi:hypothetical protein